MNGNGEWEVGRYEKVGRGRYVDWRKGLGEIFKRPLGGRKRGREKSP